MPRLWKKSGHGGLLSSLRHLRGRRGKPDRRQPGATQSERSIDTEAGQPARRRLQREAKHCALDEPQERDSAREQTPLRTKDKLAILEQDMSYDEKVAAITAARDNYEKEKRGELGDKYDEVEDEVMFKFARKSLLAVDSTADLMLAADNLIEEDWLGAVDALPGNIYRLAVMGGVCETMTGETYRYQLQAFAKMLGILSVCMVQIVGPPMIFLSYFAGIGVLYEHGYSWRCCPWHPNYDPTSTQPCKYDNTLAEDVSYFDDWGHVATTKFLGILVMIMFLLNSLFVLMDERHSWKQIYNTFRYLDVLNPRFKVGGLPYLYIDALANIWVIGWCSLDVFLVIGASPNPTAVLMNALGLLFLYNLDDVGGDLGFVNEDDWPGLRLAWIYSKLVLPAPDDTFDEEKLDMPGLLTLALYNSAIILVIFMVAAVPLLTVFTPFIQIVPEDG